MLLLNFDANLNFKTVIFFSFLIFFFDIHYLALATTLFFSLFCLTKRTLKVFRATQSDAKTGLHLLHMLVAATDAPCWYFFVTLRFSFKAHPLKFIVSISLHTLFHICLNRLPSAYKTWTKDNKQDKQSVVTLFPVCGITIPGQYQQYRYCVT